jgi:hypothetical protein
MIRIGVKKPEDLDTTTLLEYNKANLPMEDIIAIKGEEAQAALRDILAGVPPGTGWLWRPLRWTPLPESEAIAQARAKSTPDQLKLLEQLLAHRKELE